MIGIGMISHHPSCFSILIKKYFILSLGGWVMNFYSKFRKIQGAVNTEIGKRVNAEIRYAMEISKAQDGKYDMHINNAIEYLYTKLTSEGVISNEAATKAEEMLLPIKPEAKKYKLHCVSHAHIDMNWMWGFQETVNVTLDTFRTMLTFMSEYPDFTFSQSQASVYRIAEEYDPEMFDEIKSRVKEGRWEVTASTWTETDKNMPSGESLSRHILYTKQYFMEKFGLESDDLQLDFEPDTFGHNINVPEILNKGGVKYYYHCRGSERYDAYRYRAPSGKEVLCYQEPVWYNANISEGFFEYIPDFCNKCGISIGLKVYGVGDHGGGPSRRDIEKIQEMQNWPIAPTIIFSTYHNFFKELEKSKDSLPVVDKELNYIFTGCFSSQSRIKASNRIAEDRLYNSETASALSYCFSDGFDYSKQYAKAWEKIMFNQFHDILPGSCVQDSREHALGEFQNAMAYSGAGMTKALLNIADKIDTSGIFYDLERMSNSEGGGVGYHSEINNKCINYSAERGCGKTRILHIFNNTAFDRAEPTEITIWDWDIADDLFEAVDTYGNVIKTAIVEKGGYWAHSFIKIMIWAEVGSFGYNTYILREKERNGFTINYPLDKRLEQFPKNILENDFVRAEFDDNMCLISLRDNKTGLSLIETHSCFLRFIEQNTRHNKQPSGWTEGEEVYSCNMNQEGRVYITHRNYACSLRKSIKYTIEYRSSKVDVTVSLDEGACMLTFNITTDWRELGIQGKSIPGLKFQMPFSYEAQKYEYEIPYGSLEREEMHHDAPGRSFVYAINQAGNKGVCLLSNTIYAYCGENNSISATLVRSTTNPDRTPEFGMHTNEIGVAVLPHDRNAINKAASSFIHSMQFVSVRPHKGNLPLSRSFIKVDGNVNVSAVKTPEHAKGREIILRLYEIEGKSGECKITFADRPVSAKVTDILERTQADTAVSGNIITVFVHANEVVTLRVKF